MAVLLDTNILLRAIDRTHPMHGDAAASVEVLLGMREPVCITPQNVIEFWSVCTRPIARNGLGLPPAKADTEASRLESLLTVLPDHASIYPQWRRLVVAHGVSGVQVHDARLVAVMNVYGVARILTFNTRDFARYAGIRALLPRQVLRPA